MTGILNIVFTSFIYALMLVLVTTQDISLYI